MDVLFAIFEFITGFDSASDLQGMGSNTGVGPVGTGVGPVGTGVGPVG